MKKISNRDSANQYYQLINKEVDDFSHKTKARSSEIHRYLSKNGKKFLKRLDLSDVVGIENVLQDVISHRKHMEDDQVITFESFAELNESIDFVGSPSLEHEKVLSDLFNTSLGHIDLVDSQTHLYRINDFGNYIYVVIFNQFEIEKFKNSLISKLVDGVKNSTVEVGKVQLFSFDNISFLCNDFVDDSLLTQLVGSKVSSEFVYSFIESLISSSSELSTITDFNRRDVGSYKVWVLNPQL